MRFGTKASEAPERGSQTFIKYARKGETKLRFLQEVGDWYEYYEHFNPTPGGFAFPCTGDKKTCPGCTSELEKMQGASRRYLVNVLLKGYVEPFKVTAKLKDRFVTRSERNGGTLTDRDYTIINSGDGEYDYDQEMKSAVDINMYKPQFHDPERLLYEAFKQEWPDHDLGGYEPPPAPEPTKNITVGGKTTGEQEPPPSKPAEAQEQPKQEQNGSDQEITIEQLQAMKYAEIIRLLEGQDIKDYPEDASKPELITWIERKFS